MAVHAQWREFIIIMSRGRHIWSYKLFVQLVMFQTRRYTKLSLIMYKSLFMIYWKHQRTH